MDMHVGDCFLDRVANIDVVLAGVFRVDAALQAHFRRTHHVRLDCAALDLVQPQVIRLVPQVFVHFALGEGAKLAFEIADVGVVDIPVDDVTDGVTVYFGP